MLSLKTIDKALQQIFSKIIRTRGKAYHQMGMVGKANITDDTISSYVHGSDIKPYIVQFKYNPHTDSLEGTCTCPYDGACKHQAAVLLEAKYLFEKSPPTSSLQHTTSSPQKKSSKKSFKTRTLFNRRNKQLSLKGGNTSGTFRRLPLDQASTSDIIRQLGTTPTQNFWEQNIEGTFLSETTISLSPVISRRLFFMRGQEYKVLLQIQKDGIYTQCQSCNKKTSKLCEHQTSALQAMYKPLQEYGFLQGRMDYDALLEAGSKQMGVEKNAFDQYFQLKINPKGLYVVPSKDNVYSTAWLKEVKQKTTEYHELRHTNSEEQLKKLQQGDTQKFAFFWGKEGSNYYNDSPSSTSLSFAHGKGYKNKREGIVGTGRVVKEYPTDFREPHKSIGQQLFFAQQEADPAVRFAKLQDVLQQHLEEINNIYTYVSNYDLLDGTVRASDMYLVTFDPEPLECTLHLYQKDGLVHLERRITHDERPFDYSDIVYESIAFGATETTAYLYPNHQFRTFMKHFKGHDTVILPFTNRKDYSDFVQSIEPYFDIETDENLLLETVVLENPTYQVVLREAGAFVAFEPTLKHKEYSFNAFDTNNYQVEDKIYKVADDDRQFLLDFIRAAHPDFEAQMRTENQLYVYLDVHSMIEDYWFLNFNESCEAADIEVIGVKNLSNFKYTKHRAVTHSHVKSGIDWFEVDMGVSFGNETVKAADWIKALRNKETYVKLKDGSLGMLPEEWLKQARQILAVADVEKDKIKISKYRFNIIDELFENIDDKKVLKELKVKKKRLAQIELDKKHPLPDTVTAELRPYQKQGFAWLKFLDETEFGGVLADDMGLGKTLQVISLLADTIDRGTSLIVVPRSLLFNWAAELDKFCPTLQYVIHHGVGRAKDTNQLQPIDLIITTYGTVVSDIELFKEYKFNYIVLDESQAIKNPASKRYKAMRLLQSRNKIAMTGTPIENNTLDLYAQMNFTSPGLLGTMNSFKNNFATPIDNHGDTDAATLLRKLVHPFLLRRTKEQVAKDLPDKTETVLYCEMGPTQRKLYENLKLKIKEDIESEIEEKGVAQSKFKMLDGLLRLRQMCNSPLLLNSTFKGKSAESVKVDVLIQHITEELGNHNALVFSQFVSLLSIVRKELDKRGIKYAYLDGSTSKRQAEVDYFMNTDDVKLFLISLKAGNTGMNLTKADYVYILDPWWNPAVEAQAIDRTHRIGQDKHIFAYKLICKNSIEEKILKLQQKKAQLAKDIIRTDENVLKSLKKDELLALFD